MKKQRVLLAIASLILVLSLNFLQDVTKSVSAQSAQEIPRQLEMVTSADYPPYEFRDTAVGNEIIGFDIDIANYIAQELGFKLTITDTDFNGIIPALQSGRADFAMAGMKPTEERKKNVDFSEIYYEAKNAIVARKGSNLTKTEDLANKIVVVQLGSVQEELAQTVAEEVSGVQIKSLNKTGEIIQEIKADRVDAAIIEEIVAKGFIASNPELELHTILSTESTGSAIAFPKGSNLVDDFNLVLQEMKESGELERLVNKWFGDQEGTATTTEVETDRNTLSFARIAPSIPFIIRGVGVTLLFTALSALFGFIWGTVLSLAKISNIKLLTWLANAYTSVFRGTPLLLQIALVYYATPQLTGYNISALLAGVITFTLNSGAYISETIRGGILAVDKGQREAALSLGVAYKPMMLDIILPQAIKNILPALVNESIALLKDSALVSTIGVADLLRRAQIVGAEQYIYFEPLLFAGAVYYVMVMGLTWGGYALEQRLQRSS